MKYADYILYMQNMSYLTPDIVKITNLLFNHSPYACLYNFLIGIDSNLTFLLSSIFILEYLNSMKHSLAVSGVKELRPLLFK